MKKLLLVLSIFLTLKSEAQQASRLLNIQAFPYQNFDVDNILGVRLEFGDYRIYAFNKWSLIDTTLKIATKTNLSSFASKSTQFTINGVTHDLGSNFSWAVGDVTISQLSTSLAGYVPTSRTINGYSLSSNVTLSKSDFGLSNVDNTSDANKPISNSVQTALNAKQASITLTTSGSGSATFSSNVLNIPTPTAPTIPVTSVFGRTGAIVQQVGDYNTDQVSEGGTNRYYTDTRARASISAGTGLSYNASTGVFTNTSPNQPISITGTNGITVTGSYPSFGISQTTPSYNNAPGRPLSTVFRPSATRPTRVTYTINIVTALSLLNLNSSGLVQLQISSDGSTNWTTVNSAGVTKTLSVAITIGLNETAVLNLSGEIPAGWYARLLPTISGGATASVTNGQEVTY